MTCINKAKYAEIGRKIRELPQEKLGGSSHQWEELVDKMCASDDIGLHDIGVKELSELKYKA